MPISTRGRVRETRTCVAISNAMFYGFKAADLSAIAGVSTSDIVALGQKDPTTVGAGANVIYGSQAPKGALFRKKLTGGNQDSLTTYGDGTTQTTVLTAMGAGFDLVKPIRTASLSKGKRSTAVGIELSNAVIVYALIPNADLTSGAASILGWQLTLNTASLKLLVRGGKMKAARVSKTNAQGVTLTYPCATAKLDEAQEDGWLIGERERLA